MTLVFECFDTVRFQVQEMARAEKIIGRRGHTGGARHLQPVVAGPGGGSATVFIELTSDGDCGSGCPAWSGLSASWACRSAVKLSGRVPRRRQPRRPSPRETVTPAVHYVRFAFSDAQVEAFAEAGEVALVATHPGLRGQDRADRPAVRRELLGGSPRHNKGPGHRLTRDNSLRKSIQAHRSCAILVVRRIWSCRGRSIDQKGLRTGRIKYPPFYPLLRKCFQ